MTKTVEIRWEGNSAFAGKVRVAEMAYNMLEQCWNVRLGDRAGRSYMPESETRAWVEGWLGVGADKPGGPPVGYRAYLKSDPFLITDLPHNVRQALIDLDQCDAHILSKPDGTVVITVTPKAESAPEKPKPVIEWKGPEARLFGRWRAYVQHNPFAPDYIATVYSYIGYPKDFHYAKTFDEAKAWCEAQLLQEVEAASRPLEPEPTEVEPPQPTEPKPVIEWKQGCACVDGLRNGCVRCIDDMWRGMCG